jgi:TonB family protein
LRNVLQALVLALMLLAVVANAGAQTTVQAVSLTQTIHQCVQAKWKRPTSNNIGPLPVIKLRLRFKLDGTLATPPVVANPQDTRIFLTTSNSVATAVHACTPFRLPRAKYELWKDIGLTFDPREVVSAPAGDRDDGAMRPSGITHSAENDMFGRAVIRAMRETMPKSDKTGRVTIRLVLSDNGQLQEIYFVIGSGDPNMDRSVMSAVTQTRFPLPPEGATVVDRTFIVDYIYR